MVEILNQARRVPDLHRCTPESLAFGIMRLASLRLNPAIPNECWLIPRKGQAEPQYGYGGLRKLVLRSPEVIDCFSREVCVNDVFASPVTPVSLPTHQIPPFLPRGRVIGYYNVIQKHNGNWLTLMMSVAEVLAHRDRYAQQDRNGQYGSAWSNSHPDKEGLTNQDRMGLKTVLRMNCSPRNVSLEADVWDAIKSEAVDLRRTTPALEIARPPLALAAPDAAEALDVLTGELFGDTHGSPNAHRLAMQATGATPEPPKAPHGTPVAPEASQEPFPSSAWRDILAAHQALATGDLALQVHEALTRPDYSPVAGNRLAMVLADLAGTQEEG
jgi:recombinational DNA repair protein RecT